MSTAQMTQKIAIDLNGTGTLVDVSQYLRGFDGIQKTGTRQDQFRDAVPSAITFVLENYDGRFTPGTSITPYTSTLTEGMQVNWQDGTQFRAFAVQTITPQDDNWNLLTVTCQDALANLALFDLVDLFPSLVVGAGGAFLYQFGDAVGGTSVSDYFGNGPLQPAGSGVLTLGVAGLPYLTTTQANVTAPLSGNETLTNASALPSVTYPTASLGTYGLLLNPLINTSNNEVFLGVTTNIPTGSGNLSFGFGILNGSWAESDNVSGQNIFGSSPTVNTEYLATLTLTAAFSTTWTITATMKVNGSTVGTVGITGLTSLTLAQKQLRSVSVTVADLTTSGAQSVNIAAAFHCLTDMSAVMTTEMTNAATEAIRITSICTAAGVPLATLPTGLSTALLGYARTSGQSALDALNVVIKTEQGYLDTVTTGTLTAPSQSVRVRARDRPTTVSYSFDAQTELLAQSGGTPVAFVRDATNLIWADAVSGANFSSLLVQQQTLQGRARNNNSSDTVATYVGSDLYEFGSDRLWRGSNIALRPLSVVIDNRVLATDRSADLLAMVPGDRIRLTNIPPTVLGFTTWDGWLLDKDEDHRAGPNAGDKFTLYLQPCQPTTAIWDTDLWLNGGNNVLTTAMTNVATSAVVGSADGITWFEQTTVGYYIQIDAEVMKVTAAAAPSGSTQTLTVTRAQNSTTAAAHALGAIPEVVDNPSDVATNSVFQF